MGIIGDAALDYSKGIRSKVCSHQGQPGKDASIAIVYMKVKLSGVRRVEVG